MTQLTDILTNLITNLYVSTGLLGILLAMAIESCCIPLPSEIVMPLAGIMIASGKILHGTNSFVALLLVALVGAIGCLLGSIVAYGIGYSGGRPLMLKYGRSVLISQHDADKADAFFKRWGSATAFFSRLLPVVRTYISLPAGIAEMPFAKFCIYTLLGSFPWCLLLAYLGTILGNHLYRLGPIFKSLDVVIVVAIVLLVALYIWRHIRNDRKARAELAAQELTAVRQAEQHPLHPNWEQQGWNSQQSWNGQTQQPQQQGWNSSPQQYPQQPSQLSWSDNNDHAPISGQQFQQPLNQSWGQQPSPQQGWNQQPPQRSGDNEQPVHRG